MTVSTQTSRADYTGNGATTAFTVPFYFLDNSHVQIIRTQISTGVATTLALTTDYTLSGAGVNAGGTATMVTAPTADQRLTILRNVPFTQLTQYVPNDPFPAASHERALDLLTMEVQQLYENVSRSLTLSANSSGVSAALPSPQAGTLVGWNGTATALQNYNAGSLGVAISYAAWQAANFSGDGVTTSFIIPTDAGVAANCAVSVGGVVQAAGINYTYTAATRTITFLTGAPPVGANNVNIRYGQALAQGTVASASITDSTTFGRSVLTAASASAAGLAASGANSDITSLSALASVPAVVAQYSNQIKTIGASVAANALTITAGALSLDFRSTTLGSGAVTTVSGTPTNLVVPSTATLGTVNAIQSDLIVLALNNAGTIELAVVNLAGGNDLSETGLISTTAISAAATSASVVYSTTARTNVAYRVIGLIRSTQATAGTWATTPSLVQGMGGNALDAMQSLGYGQTWQNVNASRAVATTYYNTTGKPIVVAPEAVSAASASTIQVNGTQITRFILSAWVVIPPGASYNVTALNGGQAAWFELR